MILTYISSISILAPIIIYMLAPGYFWSSNTTRVLAIYLIGSLISEAIGAGMGTIFPMFNSLPLLHAFTVVEFAVFLAVFRLLLAGFTLRMLTLFVIGFILAEITSWKVQPLYDYNTLMRSIESVVLLVCALLFFRQSIRQLADERLELSFGFWYSAAVLMYFSGNLIVFGASNWVLSRFAEINYDLWNFHGVLNTVFNILLAISLWMKRNTSS